MVATGVSEFLVVVDLGLVNLFEVTTEVGKLLLGFMVSGMLVRLDTRWVVTESVLIHVPLLGLSVLVRSVLMETVSVLTEVAASVVILTASVSRIEVEVSVCKGNKGVILVELGGVVAISVVEVKTDNGVMAVEVTLLFGSISIHGVVGEVGTIVMDTDSGHGVVGETVIMGVVAIENVVKEGVTTLVLVVSDGRRVGKAVTEEEPGFSVLTEYEEVENKLTEVGGIELSVMEEKEVDIDETEIEEEMILPKAVVIALVDVPSIGEEVVRQTHDVL